MQLSSKHFYDKEPCCISVGSVTEAFEKAEAGNTTNIAGGSLEDRWSIYLSHAQTVVVTFLCSVAAKTLLWTKRL